MERTTNPNRVDRICTERSDSFLDIQNLIQAQLLPLAQHAAISTDQGRGSERRAFQRRVIL